MLAGAPLPLAASSPELAALLTSLAGSMRVAEGLAKCGTLGLLLGLLLEGPAEPPPPGSGQPSAAAAGAGQHEQHRQQGGPACGDELLWRLLRCMAEHDSEQLRARFGPALERIARLLMVRSRPCIAASIPLLQ